MGLAIPQVVTSDRASGAQVIDGSLKFESGLQTYLKRTNSSSGNRKTWTLSVWMKRNLSNATFYQSFFINRTSASYNIRFNRNTSTENNTNFGLGGGALTGSRKFRDTGWFHAVLVYDTTNATEADRIKWYINGQREANFSAATYPSQSTDGEFNRNQEYGIGYYNTNTAWDGSMSQYYFIDGQALGPESFGYTDGLTNTWRPKKYTGTFGTNGFYLPMDGNSPIGEDKSGRGNNWTPVNFGGSVSLDNPIVSGARPILNTDGGGNVARPGVFGSEENLFYTVTTANGSVYQFDITSGNNPSLSFIRGATYRFDYTSHSSHPLRFSSTNPDSSTSAYTDGTNTSVSNVITITVPHNAPNTLYYYCTAHASAMNGSISVTTDETKADPYAWKNTLALPLVGSSSDVSNSVNSGSTTKVIGSGGDPAASSDTSNFYSGSFQFDGNDYLTIPNTTELTMGTGDFTVEFWYKVSSSFAGSNFYVFDFNSNGLRVQLYNNTIAFATGSSLIQVTVNGADTNSWHHIACVRSSSTAILYYNGINVGTFSSTENITMGSTASIGRYGGSGNYYSGYLQDFRVYKGIAKYTSNFIPASTNPDILPDTPSGVSGDSKLAKVTDGAVSFDDIGDYLYLGTSSDFTMAGDFTVEAFAYVRDAGINCFFNVGDYINSTSFVFYQHSGFLRVYTNNALAASGGAVALNAWNHVALVRSGSTCTLYLNGKSVATFTNSATFSGDVNIGVDYYNSNRSAYTSGFISNLRYINGTALYTSNFTPPSAPLTNVTNTKLLCCQSNTSAIEGAVKPGTITAAGNAAATTFNPFTTDINEVRGQETGYATLNPLDLDSNASLSNGNLTISSTTNGWNGVRGTTEFPSSGGKWYFEVLYVSGTYFNVGIDVPADGAVGDLSGANSVILYEDNGTVRYNNQGSTGTISIPINPGMTFGVAVNHDTKSIQFYIDNILTHSATYTTPKVPAVSGYGTWSGDINFGQKPFKFPPPAGFQPLNAANVKPVKVIARSDQYVRATIYTGSNGTNHKITSGIDADLVWIKNRSSAFDSVLYDTIRISDGSGVAGASRSLSSNRNLAQGAGGEVSLLSDGFNLHYATANFNASNNYVAWSWRAGGSKNTFNKDDVGYASAAAAGLDGGSLAVTGASVGTKQGFSIIKFASGSSGNKTLSHGLLETPTFILVKTTGASSDWSVYHKDLGGTVNNYLVLNSDAANATASNIWGAAVPTSSVFGINPGTTCATNQDVIAYLWHDVPGLQKFGKYSGNNNANGPFIELGFRPTLFAMKQLTGTGYWMVYDSARDPINNGSPYYLFWNADSAQGTGYDLDFLSNGVKLRTNNANFNSSTPYVYMAWAEAPTFNLFGAQSNAR